MCVHRLQAGFPSPSTFSNWFTSSSPSSRLVQVPFDSLKDISTRGSLMFEMLLEEKT